VTFLYPVERRVSTPAFALAPVIPPPFDPPESVQ
jgi:hypothetical protein